MFAIQDRETAKKLLEVFFEHSTTAKAREIIDMMGEDAYMFMAWESLDLLEDRAVNNAGQSAGNTQRVMLEADLNFQEIHAACRALQITPSPFNLQ